MQKNIVIAISIISFVLVKWIFGFLGLLLDILLKHLSGRWMEYGLLIVSVLMVSSLFFFLSKRGKTIRFLVILIIITAMVGGCNYLLNDYYGEFFMENIKEVGIDRVSAFTSWFKTLDSVGIVIIAVVMLLIDAFRLKNISESQDVIDSDYKN